MEINSKFLETARVERIRLEQDSLDLADNVFGQNFIVKCDGNAPEVKELVRKVLLVINHAYSNTEWPDLDEWLKLLPVEFTRNFASEPTHDEVKKYTKWWSSLSYKKKLEQARKKQKWSLGNWLAWMEPSERLWFWWGAAELDEKNKQDYFFLSLSLVDELYVTGALEVLFEYCGAISIEMYEPATY